MPKPKRRAVTITGKARSAAVAKHAPELRRRIGVFLKAEGARIAAKASALYAEAIKSDEDKVKRILADLGLDSWDDLAEAVQSALVLIYEEGGAAAIKELGIEGGADFFDALNQTAIDYAKTRGAELVGMKWVNGELVENPRAEWAITDTTREELRDLIERAFSEGLSPTALGDEIQDSYGFSSARSDMIARTELSFAHTEGTNQAMRDSGVVTGKSLILSDGHDIEDECDDAEAQGVVDLSDDSIDPPLHPNCECSLVYETAQEEEAA